MIFASSLLMVINVVGHGTVTETITNIQNTFHTSTHWPLPEWENVTQTETYSIRYITATPDRDDYKSHFKKIVYRKKRLTKDDTGDIWEYNTFDYWTTNTVIDPMGYTFNSLVVLTNDDAEEGDDFTQIIQTDDTSDFTVYFELDETINQTFTVNVIPFYAGYVYSCRGEAQPSSLTVHLDEPFTTHLKATRDPDWFFSKWTDGYSFISRDKEYDWTRTPVWSQTGTYNWRLEACFRYATGVPIFEPSTGEIICNGSGFIIGDFHN